MLKEYFLFLFVFHYLPAGFPISLLCGNTKEVELGSNSGAGAALALALVRPPFPLPQRMPCTLRLIAPDAAAFSIGLIDVKESIAEWDLSSNEVPPPSSVSRKWRINGLTGQNPASLAVTNITDSCKLFIYIGEAIKPTWWMWLCGGDAATVAARTGTKLMPARVRLVWSPPATPYQPTDKLRLVITAVYTGAVCQNESHFVCGSTSLCVSSYLICDGIRHCPGGEDEAPAACMHRREPPLLELLRKFAARNQELLGLDQANITIEPSVIMKIGEGEQKPNAFMEFAAALKPYGPWSYLVVGMLICATILMFCLAWECCCKRSKPSDTPVTIPASCMDMTPTVTFTGASQNLFSASPISPPEYEDPPSYSSLFPPAIKCEEPVPQCSSQPD